MTLITAITLGLVGDISIADLNIVSQMVTVG